MPQHNFAQPRGRVENVDIASSALEGNLLGDPTLRRVAVYLPEGYDNSDADYPLLVALPGFTGSGLKHLAWRAFGESLPQRLDRLVGTGQMGPVVLALPDTFTSLGGNQHIDSAALGRWEAFLLEETLPVLEERFRVRREPGDRAVFGKSSGGYGAIVQGLKHGERWGAVACHSGDIGFETVYLRDMPRALDALAPYDGNVTAFLDKLRDEPKIGGDEFYALMLLAMCATYDPDPEAPAGVRLPVDPHTCELIAERWECWVEHDPLRLIDREECQQRLRGLQGLFLDCGTRDQYYLHYGTRAFVRRLERLGIDHRYEEFADNHTDIDYRMDVSLPFLYRALTENR